MRWSILRHYVKRSRVDELKSTNAYLNSRVDCLKEELSNAKLTIAKVLPKLLTISVDNHIDTDNYRVCVDIDRRAVERVMCHGDSDNEIRFIASLIAEAVETKIVKFNIFRP